MADYSSFTTDELFGMLDMGGVAGAASPSVTPDTTVDDMLAREEERKAKGAKDHAGGEGIEEEGLGSVYLPGLEDAPADIAFTAKALEEGNIGEAALGVAATALPVSADALQAVFVPLMAALKGNKISPKDAEKALELIDRGELEEVSKQFPQISVGVDNIPRYEVSDAGFKPKGRLTEKDVVPEYPERLGDRFDHPELFDAFPKLADVKIVKSRDANRWDSSKKELVELKAGSMYSPKQNTIYIKDGAGIDTVVHELQHAIQDAMGTPVGGSVKGIMKAKGISEAKAQDFYYSLIGEVEARDAAKRFQDAVPPGGRLSAIDKRLVTKDQSEQIDTGIPRRLNPKYLTQDSREVKSNETVFKALVDDGSGRQAGGRSLLEPEIPKGISAEDVSKIKEAFPDATLDEIKDFIEFSRGGGR